MNMLISMIKEEWRIHSGTFGGFMFALFPALIVAFSFAGSMILPLFQTFMPDIRASMIIQIGFLLFGMSIGSFGLMGREFMNRRFGQASLIAFSSRTLPVSEKKIFANFLVKDIIFYMFLWIVPFVIGYGISLPLLGGNAYLALNLLEASFVWFIFGLSISFVLSTIYANSRIMFLLFVPLLSFGIFMANMAYPLFSISLFPKADALLSISLLAVSFLLCALSIRYMKIDYAEHKRRFGNSLDKVSKLMPIGNSYFMAKDMLDLNRSEGGAGKIIFSFLFPLAMVWVAITVMLKIIPETNVLPLLAIFLGAMSSTIYNWLTEFDLFTSYAFLPVKVSEVIKSKIQSYALLNIISVVILLAAALWFNQMTSLPQSMLCLISVSAYSLSVFVYLSGLYPNIMLYSAKTFTQYIIMNTPVLLTLIFSSLLLPQLLFASPLLILVSVALLRKGFRKWDDWGHPSL